MQKVFFTGTHRVRFPEDTFAAIEPLFPEYGITRLADVTGLDVIGIPVVMSVRPAAVTLSVSQGKGATLLLAKISGAMEAIELWHAENSVPQAALRDAPARALDLPYPVTELAQHEGSLLSENTPLDWIEAQGIAEDASTLVPRQAIHLGYLSDRWRVPSVTATSNGLASGNTVAEATAHALYEAIERNALGALWTTPASERVYIDPTSVDEPYCADLIERVSRAGAWLELEYVASRLGIPCMLATLWHEDAAAAVMFGSGTHCDPAVALSRAITEAAQSRLTFISGARDDIVPGVYRPGRFRPPATIEPQTPWPQVTAALSERHFATDTAEAAWLARRIAAVTSWDPKRVVLGSRAELAVVKVICPGLAHHARHDSPRPVDVAEGAA